MGSLHIQKPYISSRIYDSINICSYTFYIVCALFLCTKNIQRLFQVATLIVLVLYSLYSLFVQKTNISSLKPFLVWTLYKFYTVCIFFFLYRCRNLMYISCTFIIIKSFDLYNLCIQNMYKFNVLYNFGIHFVQFLYKFFGKGGYKIRTFGRNELTTKYNNKLIWTCLDLLTFKRIIWL